MKHVDRGVLLVLAGLAVLVLLSPVLMGSMMGWGIARPGMMGGYAAPGAGWTWGLGMGIGGLVLLGVVLGTVLLVGWTTTRDDALSILRRRYAAGEIDRETYERMLTELRAA